ncbi:signal peptidase II [Chloroflexota bacterium]
MVTVFFLSLLIVTADQLSKFWISLHPQWHTIVKMGFFRLIHSQNTGAIFGLFQDQSLPLTIAGLITVTFILAVLLSSRFPLLNSRPSKLALSLVLGGAISNLTERLRFGYVTDFIDIGIWPVFNIADSAITIGVLILAYSLLCSARAEKHQSLTQV